MPTADIDYVMNFEESQQSEADKKLLVLFYKDVIKNEPKSIEAGRPIFDEINLVKIITPGSRDSFVGDATETYQQRFPQQWARYKAGQNQNLAGTPLNQLTWLSIAQIAEFNAVGCHTVEQLAGMSDAISMKFMGHHAIKQRAQQYLDLSKDRAPMVKLEAELKKRDEIIEELRSAVSAMQERQMANEEALKTKVA